jgi:hypothetical protein
MRRFMSWATLYGCTIIGTWILKLVISIFFSILWLLIDARFFGAWIYNTGGGFVAVFGLFYILSYAADFVMNLSQKVEHSRRGIRYKVLGFSMIALGVLATIGELFFGERTDTTLLSVTYDLSCAVYGGILAYNAKGVTERDGMPLSKKERLLQKLSEIEEREGQ